MSYVSLFLILSAVFLLDIWTGLQLGKLSQKQEGWNFFWDTVYIAQINDADSCQYGTRVDIRVTDVLTGLWILYTNRSTYQ